MHITFLLDAPRCRTADDFLIRDLPGTSGRLDVVCRILAATFHTVPEWCSNLAFLASLGGPPNPPLLLQVNSPTSQSIPESELACAVILKGLFHHYLTTNESQHLAFPQFVLKHQDWSKTLQSVSGNQNNVFYLVERGTPLEEVKLDASVSLVFILGDDRGIPREHEKLLQMHQVRELSIGSQSYLGSQVVKLILLELSQRFSKKPSK